MGSKNILEALDKIAESGGGSGGGSGNSDIIVLHPTLMVGTSDTWLIEDITPNELRAALTDGKVVFLSFASSGEVVFVNYFDDRGESNGFSCGSNNLVYRLESTQSGEKHNIYNFNYEIFEDVDPETDVALFLVSLIPTVIYSENVK